MTDVINFAVSMPDDTKLGPAMAALKPRHRAFVLALLQNGGNASAAAGAAGYSDGPNNNALRVRGWELSHDPRIQAALLEETRKQLQFATVIAANYLVEVVGDTTVDAKERVKAAQLILDRGGMHALTEHKVTVTHQQSREDKIQRVLELAKLLGQDPRTLLGDLMPKEMGAIEHPPAPQAAAIDVTPKERNAPADEDCDLV